jgi:hypothetical protein
MGAGWSTRSCRDLPRRPELVRTGQANDAAQRSDVDSIDRGPARRGRPAIGTDGYCSQVLVDASDLGCGLDARIRSNRNLSSGSAAARAQWVVTPQLIINAIHSAPALLRASGCRFVGSAAGSSMNALQRRNRSSSRPQRWAIEIAGIPATAHHAAGRDGTRAPSFASGARAVPHGHRLPNARARQPGTPRGVRAPAGRSRLRGLRAATRALIYFQRPADLQLPARDSRTLAASRLVASRCSTCSPPREPGAGGGRDKFTATAGAW